MKASKCKGRFSYCLLSLRPSTEQLAMVFTVMTLFAVTESAGQIQLHVKVGGNVTFHCAQDTQRTIELMYFQRGQIFVNGFYLLRNLTNPTWQNTQVDQEGSVYMYNVNVSHHGEYNCHVRFIGNDKIDDTTVSLFVTAPYSKPSITKQCYEENHSCFVTCTSHGGFPRADITWNVTGTGNNSSQLWKRVNISTAQCQNTSMFSSSSTAYFNCSGGEVKFSCSVGDSTSLVYTICVLGDPLFGHVMIIVAIVTVAIFVAVAVAVGLWKWKWKTRQMRTAAAAEGVKTMWGENEEETALRETSLAS